MRRAATTLTRSRWAAVGATLAISVGAGGVLTSSASAPVVSAALVPITPCRLVDTRPPATGPRSTPIGPTEIYTALVWGTNGHCSIPTTATAVSLNVVAIDGTAASYLTVFPAAPHAPLASNLNWTAGQAPTPNAVTSKLSTDGKLGFYNDAGTVDVAVDIVGYYIPTTSGLGTTGPPGPPGPAGPKGDRGPVNRITNAQIANLRWDQDPGHNATVTVDPNPNFVAFDGTDVWVASVDTHIVSPIDPATGTALGAYAVGVPSGLAFDGTGIWVSTNQGSNPGKVFRINPTTKTIDAVVTVGVDPRGMASDGTNLWVANNGSGTVSKISLATKTVVGTVTLFGTPTDVAFDGSEIWVTNFLGNEVTKINRFSNAVVAHVTTSNYPRAATFDGRNLWVAAGESVMKIDPLTNTVVGQVATGSGPTKMVFDGSSVWVSNYYANTIAKIDPVTSAVTATVNVGVHPVGVTFDGTNLWVANSGSASVSKLLPSAGRPAGPGQVVWVAKSGSAFSSVGAALASITDNNNYNRYVVKIAPGVYTETGPIDLKSYVDIEGSGENATVVTCACSGSALSASSATLRANGADIISEVRSLTVSTTGTGLNSIGLFTQTSGSARVSLGHVTVSAQAAPSSYANAVVSNGAALSLTDTTVTAAGGQDDVGIRNTTSSLALDNVTVKITGGPDQNVGLFNLGASPSINDLTIAVAGAANSVNYGVFNWVSSPTMANVTAGATGSGTGTSYGVFNQNGSAPTMTNVTATAGGSATNVGVENDASSPVMRIVVATAMGGTNSIGIRNLGGGAHPDDTHPAITGGAASASGATSTNTGIWNNAASPELDSVAATAEGGLQARGIVNNGDSLVHMVNMTIRASGGSTNQDWGVDNFESANITIRDSRITGSPHSVLNNSFGFFLVINSQLSLTGSGSGTLKCVNAYTGGLDFFNGHCQ